MNSYVLKIYPEKATEMLEKNVGNRPVRKQTVARLARDMKAGNWKLNGQAIIFGKSGKLLTGQHRLLACVQAAVPFETWVIEDIEDEVQATMDKGTPRRFSDELNAHTFKWYRNVASGVIAYQILTKAIAGEGVGIRYSTNSILSPVESLHIALSDMEGWELAGEMGWRLRAYLSPRVGTALFKIFAGVNKEQAILFFEKLISGAGLGEGNPILVLRNDLVDKNYTFEPDAAACKTINAWNCFRKQISCKQLHGPKNGRYPTVI